MIDRNGVQAGTEDSRACSGNSLIQGEPAEEEKRSALVWAGFWLYDGQTRNYRAGSCLSGLESRIPLSMYTSRTSLGLLRPGGHNSIHASISNGLAIVLIDMSKDPQVDPSDRRLLAEEIRGSVEFGSC
jgi:hypothetical protein